VCRAGRTDRHPGGLDAPLGGLIYGPFTRAPAILIGDLPAIARRRLLLTLLAVACHRQLDDLCAHFEPEPGRRVAMTRGEVVERAVAAVHLATIPPPTKRKR
jgi:hypothetical protein